MSPKHTCIPALATWDVAKLQLLGVLALPGLPFPFLLGLLKYYSSIPAPVKYPLLSKSFPRHWSQQNSPALLGEPVVLLLMYRLILGPPLLLCPSTPLCSTMNPVSGGIKDLLSSYHKLLCALLSSP